MLKSKFKKEPAKAFRATKIFTDREEPRTVFDNSVHVFCNGQKDSEILVYYGVGGIGKTKLLKELFKRADDTFAKYESGHSINKVYVSLDAYDYSNPVNVLMSIRRQLNIDCGIFDYALLQYSVKAKQTVQDISRKFMNFDSPVISIINELISLGMGSVSVPASVLKKSVEVISDISFKRKYKDEITEIEGYSEFEIYQRLPYYLGISVLNATQKGKKHIFFIDSYESILLRTNNSALVEDSEEWLKELFLSSENTLFVIASREKIKWYEDDIEWNEYLNQHILERLADEDSRYFLSKVPIVEDEIKQSIVTLAQGVPLYLDMCVDIYENTINSGGSISKELFNVTGNKIIGRYIRHLKDNEKYAIKVLSVVDFFDVDFAGYLLRNENLPFNNDEIKELFEKSIFVEIDEYKKIYKIDESVRQHILRTTEVEEKRSVLSNTINYINHELNNQTNIAFQYYEQLFQIIINDPEYFIISIDGLIEAMVTLVELGYWCEIHNMVQPHLNSNSIHIRSFCSFSELFYLRRTARINEANRLTSQNTIESSTLGKFRYLYEFLKIHIIHLSGDYDIALEKYKQLKKQIDLVKENVDAHTYYIVNIKLIDLLFLKGHFKTALKMIGELGDNSTISLIDKAEILRVRGHIYRFNFMLQEAAEIYNSALRLFTKERSASFEGKIYNNLVETYCYTDPEMALKYAEKSIDINKKIDSKIELGKTYAAASIAYSLLSRFEDAINYANKSIELQTETGYTSGILFGQISLFIARCLSKIEKEEVLESTISRINEITNSINAYSFLELPISLIAKDKDTVKKLRESNEWIDFDMTVDSIKKIFLDMESKE